MLRRRMRPLRSRRAAGAAFRRLSLQWLILYDSCWLLAGGFYSQAAVHLGLFGVSLTVIALLEVLDHLSAPPLTYSLEPLRPHG